MWTDDPIKDFERHEAKKQRWLDSLPVCEHCHHPIQQERAVCINGDWYCDECLDELRKWVVTDEVLCL